MTNPIWELIGMERYDWQRLDWEKKKPILEKYFGKPKRPKQKPSISGNYLWDSWIQATPDYISQFKSRFPTWIEFYEKNQIRRSIR